MLKGLEALEKIVDEIKWTHNDGKTLTRFDKEQVDIIEKELKALEILKNKKTDINLLLNNGLDFYNSCFYPRKLTQEEYELLKEVLENE